MESEALSVEATIPGWLVALVLVILVVMILWLAFTNPPGHADTDDEHLPVGEEDFDE